MTGSRARQAPSLTATLLHRGPSQQPSFISSGISSWENVTRQPALKEDIPQQRHLSWGHPAYEHIQRVCSFIAPEMQGPGFSGHRVCPRGPGGDVWVSPVGTVLGSRGDLAQHPGQEHDSLPSKISQWVESTASQNPQS